MDSRILAGITAFLLGSTSLPVWAAGEIGQPAPQLAVSAWAKGGPVDMAAGKGKNIYVIEFWATWCGPCKANIPHLTRMQRHFKDKGVTFIAISSERPQTVKSFVDQMGSKMDYAVAADKNNSMSRAYMDAFGIRGIPHAFIVDRDGRIAWHGDPRDEMEAVIERMVANSYNTTLAAETDRATRLGREYFTLVQKINKTNNREEKRKLERQARQIGDTLIKSAQNNPDALYDFCWNLVLRPNGDYQDLELAALAAEAAYRATAQRPTDRARKLMHDYLRTVQAGVPETQPETARLAQLSESVLRDGDPKVLNDFAWALLIGSTLKHRDFDLAVRMAREASTATSEQDAAILDTYSLALFVTGKRDLAIATMEKAMAVNKDSVLRERLEKMMAQYRAAPVSPSMIPTRN